MIGWVYTGRLKPARMAWSPCYPVHEMARYRTPNLRKMPLCLRGFNRVEDDRSRRKNYPRVIDEYGIDRRPKRS